MRVSGRMKLARASSSKATATKYTMLLATVTAMLPGKPPPWLRVQKIVNRATESFNDSTACLIKTPSA